MSHPIIHSINSVRCNQFKAMTNNTDLECLCAWHHLGCSFRIYQNYQTKKGVYPNFWEMLLGNKASPSSVGLGCIVQKVVLAQPLPLMWCFFTTKMLCSVCKVFSKSRSVSETIVLVLRPPYQHPQSQIWTHIKFPGMYLTKPLHIFCLLAL